MGITDDDLIGALDKELASLERQLNQDEGDDE